MALALLAGGLKEAAIADLIWIGFFYLLRPSEYVFTSIDAGSPFELHEILLRVHNVEYSGDTTPLELLDQATFAGLKFSTQKNGIKNEIIGLTCTGQPNASPVKAVIRRVAHLRQNGATRDTKLFTYYDAKGVQKRVTDRMLSQHLKLAAHMLGLDISPNAGALRATGATALLQGKVSTGLIKLIGRWRSDEVFRYLHTQSATLMDPFSNLMIESAL